MYQAPTVATLECLLKPLACWDRIIPVLYSQFHGLQCLGYWRRQDICTQDIDYAE